MRIRHLHLWRMDQVGKERLVSACDFKYRNLRPPYFLLGPCLHQKRKHAEDPPHTYSRAICDYLDHYSLYSCRLYCRWHSERRKAWKRHDILVIVNSSTRCRRVSCILGGTRVSLILQSGRLVLLTWSLVVFILNKVTPNPCV